MRKPEVEVIRISEDVLLKSGTDCGVFTCEAECNGGYGGDDCPGTGCD